MHFKLKVYKPVSFLDTVDLSFTHFLLHVFVLKWQWHYIRNYCNAF